MTYWILLKTTFAFPQSCQKQRNGSINFSHYFRFGFQEEELYAFLKTRFCNPTDASNQTHFWSKGDTKSVYMSTGCQIKSTSRNTFVIKLEYDLLVTWVQIWNTFFYIFWYWFHFKSLYFINPMSFLNSPIHLVRLYTIKFYNSNLNIANHNLRFTNFLREKI